MHCISNTIFFSHLNPPLKYHLTVILNPYKALILFKTINALNVLLLKQSKNIYYLPILT
jgi:hypothetical protein